MWCKTCGIQYDDSNPSCPECSKAREKASYQNPGRGNKILVLGILSILFPGLAFFLGIPAWVMGAGDIRKIDKGKIVKSARGKSKAGMILGIIGTSISAFILVFFIFLTISNSITEEYYRDRDPIISDCYNIAAYATQYYHRPAKSGGGDNSFIGYSLSPRLKETYYGTYSLEDITDESLTIIGLGKVIGEDEENPVKVVMRISPVDVLSLRIEN